MARDRRPDDVPAWVQDAGAHKKACDVCGDTFEFWTSLTMGQDGQRRCATCHVGWLKRFVCKPTDRCTEPDCTLTVAEHIAEFRRLGRLIQQRIITPSEPEAFAL